MSGSQGGGDQVDNPNQTQNSNRGYTVIDQKVLKNSLPGRINHLSTKRWCSLVLVFVVVKLYLNIYESTMVK